MNGQMEKQIEGMALDIMKVSSLPLEISGAIAIALTEQGYRKESDVVTEVLGKVREETRLALDSNYKARHEHLNKYPNIDNDFVSMVGGKISALRGIDDFIDEIEKKYKGE